MLTATLVGVPLTRAYSVLTVKAVDHEQRTIAGIASTPEPDRMGDVVEPLGITYKNPLPLLLYHDSKKPVGHVKFKKPTAAGLEFTASLPSVDEPGTLRDRVDEAWQSIKAGLLAGVSIGFRSIEEAFNKDTNGFRFLKTEILELSLVAIPANADATIQSIKSFDLAASGRHLSRDRDPLPIVRVDKGARPMEQKTLNEQITGFENKRATTHARMTAIMTKAAEAGATLDQAETDEYERPRRRSSSQSARISGGCARSRRRDIAKAVPVTAAAPEGASKARSGVPIISVKSLVAPGTAFIRYCQALAVAKGSRLEALDYAKRWHGSAPEVELYLKAAVAAGRHDQTPPGPAPLAPIVARLQQDFLALLRPAAILGKVGALLQKCRSASPVASQTERRLAYPVGRAGRAEARRRPGVFGHAR